MAENNDYNWVPFYEEFADKLVDYESNRKELIDKLNKIDKIQQLLSKVIVDYTDPDIDPFTVFALFNNKNTETDLKEICEGISNIFGIDSEVPSCFDGRPIFTESEVSFCNLSKSSNYKYLWRFFEVAIKNSDIISESYSCKDFEDQYENLIEHQKDVNGEKITKALFLIRPKTYLSLNKENMDLINGELKNYPKEWNTKGQDYLSLCKMVKDWIIPHFGKPSVFSKFNHQSFQLAEINEETNCKSYGWEIILTNPEFMPSKTKKNSICNMYDIYEIYISQLVSHYFNEKHPEWKCTTQFSKSFLFNPSSNKKTKPNSFKTEMTIRPDIYIERNDLNDKNSLNIIVIDAKWKQLDITKAHYGIEREDIYQIYSYANFLNAETAWLVYPAELNKKLEGHTLRLNAYDKNFTLGVYFFNIKKKDDSLRDFLYKFI